MTKILSTIAALAVLASTGASFAAGVEGVWERSNGKSKIKISKCGSKFCTKIVWMKTPRKDTKNEDASLRSRNLVGTTISNNLKPSGNKKWSGSIYNADKGKFYAGSATVNGNNLRMKGCLTSAGILCQSAKFTRSK